MTKQRALVYGGIGIGGLLALSALALAILWSVQAGKVLPNTSVAGIDVAGLTSEEAAEALAPLVGARLGDPVTFTFEDVRLEVVPEAVGYVVDVEAAVDAAMQRGREGLPGDIAERIRAMRQPRDITLQDNFDRESAAAWAQEAAERIDRPDFTGSVMVDPDTLEVEVEMPQGSATVRQEETTELLIAALLRSGSEELELPVDTEPQRVSDGDIRAVAAQAERAVAGPLELRGTEEDAGDLVLSPTTIASIMEVVVTDASDGSATLELTVSASRLEEVLEPADLERFERTARDASYEVSRTPPMNFDDPGTTTWSPVPANVDVDPGQDGTRFDPELAAIQITELLRTGARGGALRLETIDADFSTTRAQQLKPTHLIGTFTTYHPADQIRVTNIQLLADTVDDTLVMPGEQFSINAISGERSCEKGYEPAGTIVQGELVDTCGGGVSQFGTTTFNAAFFAGVQLDAWRAHSFYIARYPMGREATLSYPVLDVKFTNNTDGAIIVRASYTSDSITVSLFGQPIAESVTATHGSPTDPTEPSEIRRDTDELFVDQERVEQAGGGGFTVEVVRTVNLLSGGEQTQTIRTVYVPADRIIEEGTRPRPSATGDADD